MSVGERIKAIRDYLGMTQPEFARRIGIVASAIAKHESGVNNPSEQTLKLICNEFGVNYGYLKFGHDPMFEPRESRAMESIERIMYGDNEYVKAVFRELAAMPKEWWDQAVEMLDRIAAHKKEGR